MWFDGKIKILGEVEVTNLKELLPLIDESYWLDDNRRSVNANFSETHTLWIREFVPTNDNNLHYFDRLSKYTSLTTEWAILNTKIENIVNGECVKSGIIRLKPGKKIHRHIDGNKNIFKYCHRIVVPITSNIFDFIHYDDNDNSILDEGVIYDTNGFVPHWAVNHGEQTLYTAVFDILPSSNKHIKAILHDNTIEEYQKLSSIREHIVNDNALLSDWERYFNLEKRKKSIW